MFENATYDLTRIPYGRRGTFFYLGLWEEEGRQRLYVCALFSAMDTAAPGQKARCGRLYPVRLERDGRELEYTAEATPVCVTLRFDGGSARFCLQEGSVLRAEARGADVVIAPELNPHEIAKDRLDGSWELVMNPVPKTLFCPVRGSLEVTTGFDVVTSMPEDTRFRFRADESGTLDLAIHLYKRSGKRLRVYPAFEEVLSGIEAEFSAYLDTVPALPAEFGEARIVEAFIVWSHVIPVDGIELIYMNKGVHRMTSSWQQAYHAMGQYRNPRFAWELLCSVFRYQDETGMIPDCLYDTYQSFGGCKPPLQGVALAFLRDYTDFSFAPAAERRALYRGLSELVYWWLSWRDTDLDGIPQYDTADETGFDDTSFFRLGGSTETPDLAAYLIVAMDSLSDLAAGLEKPYEAREWKARADALLEKTLAFFWDGRRFRARRNGTHEWVDCGTVMAFLPLLLGKRLPPDVVDRMAEDLCGPGGWLTPYGLAGERLDSDFYHESGWSAGPVLAPVQLLVVLGLRRCGKDALAKEITLRWMRAQVREGFPMVLSATTGKDVSEGRWGAKYPNRMAWTAMVFLLLGSLLEEGSGGR